MIMDLNYFMNTEARRHCVFLLSAVDEKRKGSVAL